MLIKKKELILVGAFISLFIVIPLEGWYSLGFGFQVDVRPCVKNDCQMAMSHNFYYCYYFLKKSFKFNI